MLAAMSGEFEAAGTAIEGALVGAAVEGEKSDTSQNGDGACLNCGTPLNGSFCAHCGQKAQVRRSIAAIWHDILHGVLHFDGKMWRTLPMLAFKPGELTRRYIRGERAKFISPMALFLFAIFMMFAVFSFTGGPTTTTQDGGNDGGFAEAIDKQVAETRAEISRLEEVIASQTITDEERKSAEAELAVIKRTANGLANVSGLEIPFPNVKSDSDDGSVIDMDGSINTGIKWLDEGLTAGARKANTNPSLLLYKLQSNGYKFAWLLIPLSLPFVWLVTLGAGGSLRAHKFYDHAVFTTYSIAFMSLLFLVCALLTMLGWNWPWFAMVIVPPIHLYKQLRHAYQLSRWSAVLRLSLLFLSIVAILTLFLLILLFLGILG